MHCPDCNESVTVEPVDRRDFIRVVGGTAAAASVAATGGVLATSATANAALPPAQPRQPQPAEALVRELYNGLTNDQRGRVVHTLNHGNANNQTPMRLRMYNRALGQRIGQVYTRPQQELIERILRAIANGEEGYTRLSRNGTFDGSRSMQNCGADFFGDPTNGQYTFVFSGHHLTVRCDGNSIPGIAFGGPLYYGHSPNGYSQRNVFSYQTRSAMEVYDALTAQQRRQATITRGTPGEQARSVQFRPANQPLPGIPGSDLNRQQRTLVETVMRQIAVAVSSSRCRRSDANRPPFWWYRSHQLGVLSSR